MNSSETDMEKYRTFWPRFWAAFLDSGALAPLQWVDSLVWNSTVVVPVLLGWSLVQITISFLVTVGMVAKYGQTPGKMACGVRIISLDNSSVSLKQAMLILSCIQNNTNI
jgi:uncharacterized RDD family membrane protein YckC